MSNVDVLFGFLSEQAAFIDFWCISGGYLNFPICIKKNYSTMTLWKL